MPEQQIPAANQAAINPNPRPERIPTESHPSLERVTLAKKVPALVFPGRSLGLGYGPRYFEGRTRPGSEEKYREHQGATVARSPSIRWTTETPVTPLNLPNAHHGR